MTAADEDTARRKRQRMMSQPPAAAGQLLPHLVDDVHTTAG
jgi:hypothetical protein